MLDGDSSPPESLPDAEDEGAYKPGASVSTLDVYLPNPSLVLTVGG